MTDLVEPRPQIRWRATYALADIERFEAEADAERDRLLAAIEDANQRAARAEALLELEQDGG